MREGKEREESERKISRNREERERGGKRKR